MIEHGAMEGVHAAIGGHVGPVFEEVPTGTFMIKKGTASAATDNFEVVFREQVPMAPSHTKAKILSWPLQLLS